MSMQLKDAPKILSPCINGIFSPKTSQLSLEDCIMDVFVEMRKVCLMHDFTLVLPKNK